MNKSIKLACLLLSMYLLASTFVWAAPEIAYQSEFDFVRKIVRLIQEGDYESIKKLQTNEHRIFIRRDYFHQVSNLLKNTNIETMKENGFSEQIENGEKVRFINVYFENDKYLEIIFKLKATPNGFLVRGMTLDDYWGSKE